jgi:hypothetical protein
MTLSELIAEVQALTGRSDDAVLITSARIVRFLNDAQTEIVRFCPGHIDLEVKDADALTLVTSTYSYSFAALSPAVFHLWAAYYMDGVQSYEMLYRDTEDFDRDHPDPTAYSGMPTQWTRRAATIEVYPLPTTAENGKYIRLDYTKTPTAFSTGSLTATCQMSDAHKGLIYYSVAEAFRAIGGHQAEADAYKGYFNEWLVDYHDLKDGKSRSILDRLFE